MEALKPSIISVVITSRNRCKEVMLAIQSCLKQTLPCEMIVFDDASDDGTSETIRIRYPQVKLITRKSPLDSCTNRNEGFKLATGQFTVSLDDDSFFSSPNSLQEIINHFDLYPNATVLALQYVEPFQESYRGMETCPAPGTLMRSYVACAAAFRTDHIRQIGAYEEIFKRQGEERDLAIRVLDSGREIRYANTPPIVHLYSPKRNIQQMNYLGFRNTIYFCWIRIPFPECLWKAFSGTIGLLIYRFTLRGLGKRILSLASGWSGVIKCLKIRKAVTRATYHKFNTLPSHGASPANETETSWYRNLADKGLSNLQLYDQNINHPTQTKLH